MEPALSEIKIKKRDYDAARYAAIKASLSPEETALKNAKRRECYAIQQEKILQQKLEWRNRNPGYGKQHHYKHREKRLASRKVRYAERMKEAGYKIERILRTRISNALFVGRKSAKTLELLGCSVDFLREHLEKQFLPGMAWENHGPVWHVDHILPCAAFHLQHSEEQEICFHWTNLQPLFVNDNLIKGSKYV